MPVPTETFWNIRKLNVIFAASAVFLTVSVLWLIVADYNRDWRAYQQDARVWQTSMTIDAEHEAVVSGQVAELNKLKAQIADLEAKFNHSKIKELQAKIQQDKNEISALDLPTAKLKGEIQPKNQEIEAASLQYGPNSPKVSALREQLTKTQEEYNVNADKVVRLTQDIADKTAELNNLQSSVASLVKQRDDLKRKQTALEDKLAALDPTSLAGKAVNAFRDAPLLNWLNPREEVKHVDVDGVLTNYNFVKTPTTDRCATCHVNIDQPAFEPKHLVAFVERQVARAQGQDVDSIDHPVVMFDFWVNAAKRLAASAKDAFHKQALLDAVGKVRQDALDRINQLRTTAGAKEIDSPDKLDAEITRITSNLRGKELATFYVPLDEYREDLRALLRAQMGREEFKQLDELYRVTLIGLFNADRAKAHLPPVDANPVLLGHPNMELFVEADSKHPMKVMGCTVCHEGSGQETNFTHDAHVPREIWVDADTGTPVPDGFVREIGAPKAMRALIRGSHPASPGNSAPGSMAAAGKEQPKIVPASFTPGGEQETPATQPAAEGDGLYTQYDVNLIAPGHPAPYSPVHEPEGAAAYQSPVDQDGTLHLAVRQGDYWTHKYSWEFVEHKDWEKPMNSMEFIESSCSKCHTEIFDLKDSAPTLFEGRKLFAQLGCVNCHAVKDIEKAGDTTIKVDQVGPDGQPTGKELLVPRKVGPSLVHVKDKLSQEMISSWIWSPKAFRPNTRMPDFFMLENNSAPVDILRTRVEVAAITYYLTHTKPDAAAPEYTQMTPPEKTGDAENGRKIFNTVGCLACHSNMAEHGEYLIVNDLITNQGMKLADATKKYDDMSYNERQWYASEHLEDKLVNIGPELSNVGSKLTIGQTPEQARKWVYDWVHNPRHYSSYTIMPSFRLSDDEANDLAAYLLTLKRDEGKSDPYKPVDFLAQLRKEKLQQNMLAELVATLKSAQSDLKIARDEVKGMSQDDQLQFLGQKMIANYGCSGCHLINGFETATSACTDLNDWGLKDPHKLDFGNFDHAFDKEREKPITLWKVRSEGLHANAPSIDYNDTQDIHKVAVKWEEMDLERRDWAYNKLHNPRVYDRGRITFDGQIHGEGDSATFEIGKPYDKLKMPKFFLKDEQVHALVTFVTSIRDPLVTKDLQATTYDDPHRRWAYGQQVATMFNCYGCHNIEGETAHIREWFDYLPNGDLNPYGYKWAPPRLIGQGAKTQPQWVFFFLQNVDTRIRPWLQIRMPSFPIGAAHAAHITDYFAGQSQVLAKDLKTWIDQVCAWRTKNPNRLDWFDEEAIEQPVSHLKAWALKAELVTDQKINHRTTVPEEMRDNWNQLFDKLKFLQDTYDIRYPYVPQSRPEISADRFARGELLIKAGTGLGCLAGNCHTLGDPDQLAQMAEIDRIKAAEEAAKAAKEASTAPADDDYGPSPATKPAGGATTASAPASDDGYGETPTPTVESKVYVGHWIPAAPPGDPGAAGAPNLIRTGYRLQRSFVSHWIAAPMTLLPGTWMLELFPNGHSAFEASPPELKQQRESMFGWTGQEQRDLLMDFIYAASDRDYTPGAAEKLYHIPPKPMTFAPLPPPPAPKPAPGSPAATTTPGTAPESVKPEPVTPVAPPSPVAAPVKSVIDLQDGPTAAYDKGTRVVGLVKFTGTPSPRSRTNINMSTDPACQDAHPNGPAMTEGLVVNKDGSLRNAFIFVKEGLPAGQQFAIPADKANPQINQDGCVYVPHIVGMVAGQNLSIKNSDNTTHNVHFLGKANGDFNKGMLPGVILTQKFFKPEMAIPARCDVHTWMSAFVYVMPNPFFCVSDVEGRYEITGLPPGKYTLEAIQEDKRIQPVTFEVEVKDKTSVRADVTMK